MSIPTAEQAREAATRRIEQRLERRRAERERQKRLYHRRVEAQKRWLLTSFFGKRKLRGLIRDLTTVDSDEMVGVTGSRAYTQAVHELLEGKGYRMNHCQRTRRMWELEVEVWEE